MTGSAAHRPVPLFPDRPALIGHRGFGSGRREGFAENTADSLLAAVREGADWVEIDVRRTADDELVVLHDPRGSDGAFVAELDARAALAHGLPTLASLLDVLPPEVGLDIDVKSALEDALRPPDRTTAALLAPRLAEEHRRRPRMIVTSFDPAALLQLRSAELGIALGLLTWLRFPLRKAIAAAAHLGLDAVVAHTGSFLPHPTTVAPQHHDPAYAIDVAHRAGLMVGAWCPGPDDAVTLVRAGIDVLVVDALVAVRDALTAVSQTTAR